MTRRKSRLQKPFIIEFRMVGVDAVYQPEWTVYRRYKTPESQQQALAHLLRAGASEYPMCEFRAGGSA